MRPVKDEQRLGLLAPRLDVSGERDTRPDQSARSAYPASSVGCPRDARSYGAIVLRDEAPT
jgi:hypothetical protein